MPVVTRSMYKKLRLARLAARVCVRARPVVTRSVGRQLAALRREVVAKARELSERLARMRPVRAARAGEPYSWVAATHLRNYFLNDPFLDWAEYHFAAFARAHPEVALELPHVLRPDPRGDAATDRRGARPWILASERPAVGHDPGTTRACHTQYGSFSEFVMAQGVLFEAKVIAHLYRAFGRDAVKDLGGQPADATRREMARGTPILYSASVEHLPTRTYGIPDLLVRVDWLAKLVGAAPLEPDDLVPRHHYRVVDIKCSTLPLRSDGTHLLNSGSIPAYKAQLYVYNRALGWMQGFEPEDVYLLGKRWSYTSRGVTTRGTSCFDRLGVVSFEGVDAAYGARVDAAVRWVNRVREHGGAWNPLEPPLPHVNLYPNMSNKYDFPWRPFKEYLAHRNAEITSLWMCGPKNRANALAQNVFCWTDPRCTCDALGVTTEYRGPILERLLTFNRDEDAKTPVAPAKLGTGELVRTGGPEFFVDFEAVNDVVTDDFSTFPVSGYATLIFMIGVGRRDPRTKAWEMRHFVAAELTAAEQARICAAFERYVADAVAACGHKRATLYHWGSAEPSMWRGAGRRLPPRAEWRDLLGTFRNEPIVVKGCLDFGLKAIATALHRHGLIQTCWDASSACTDGATAMLRAVEAYRECRERGIPCADTPKIVEIQKYNEADCKVLYDIVEYLRAHHM